jgi:predicted RecA/RadA family phage recombinase
MAKNFKQVGDVLDYTNGTGSAIASGAVVILGAAGDATVGIALVDIADGESGAVQIDNGVFEVPKVSAAVFKQGESLIWDKSAGKFDDNQATPATGDVSGGVIAAADGANGEATCLIRLTGRAGALA